MNMFALLGNIGPWEIILILIVLLLVCVHFLPSYIAWKKKLDYFFVYLLANLLLGWTGIGWIVLLVAVIVRQPKTVQGIN